MHIKRTINLAATVAVVMAVLMAVLCGCRRKDAPAHDDDLEIEMVKIQGRNYSIGKTEVTQKLWEFVMGDNPATFKERDNPVENVSWDDCQEFLRKLNAHPSVKKSGLLYRLPTEEEWAFACRAGATGTYCCLGDGTEIAESSLGEVAWFYDNSESKPHPVGQKKPNAFGLCDMHGNVWEWTSTVDGSHRIVCGGCWEETADRCSSSFRRRNLPDYQYVNLGLRLAAD